MNPILGLFSHRPGGLAAGSFHAPFRGVKRRSWETAWLVAGFFSWIIAPWFFALIVTNNLPGVLSETPGKICFYTCLFGALWGMGNLIFGLTMRYLGMSLGMAVALGYCTVLCTLIPPLFKGEFHAKFIEPASGRWVISGLLVCVIVINALTGKAKEAEMNPEQRKKTIKEFHFKKGIMAASFSGIISACFAFGLAAEKKIAADPRDEGGRSIPLLFNYPFAAAGVSWYFQFFYTRWGKPKWVITSSAHGLCTWPRSSSSVRSGDSSWVNGKAPAKRQRDGSLSASACWFFPLSSSAKKTTSAAGADTETARIS